MTEPHQHVATLLLMVGLPGAGKTTLAGELARTQQALRVPLDHCMIPLLSDNMAGGMRFVLVGRLISCWSPDEAPAVPARRAATRVFQEVIGFRPDHEAPASPRVAEVPGAWVIASFTFACRKVQFR